MSNAKTVGDFLTRYNSFKTNNEEDDLAHFVRSFSRLRTSYEELQQNVLKEARLEAPQFNIFSLLGVARQEVTTHSAFLASLLRPDGVHGQQFLFLESFLITCQGVTDFPKLDDSVKDGDWSIQVERHTAYGNLDIVIASPTLGYLVVIENKVDAGEQNRQLARYADWLNEQSEEYPSRALIYLTPAGMASQTSEGHQYIQLSYRQDIATWLESIVDKIVAPTVRETVRQYQHLVTHL